MTCRHCGHDEAQLRRKISGLVRLVKDRNNPKINSQAVKYLPGSGLTLSEKHAWKSGKDFYRAIISREHNGILLFKWVGKYLTYCCLGTRYYINGLGITTRHYQELN